MSRLIIYRAMKLGRICCIVTSQCQYRVHSTVSYTDAGAILIINLDSSISYDYDVIIDSPHKVKGHSWYEVLQSRCLGIISMVIAFWEPCRVNLYKTVS